MVTYMLLLSFSKKLSPVSHFISLRFSSEDTIEAKMANYHKYKRKVILLPFWDKEYALVQMTRYCRFFTVSSF